MEICYLVCFSVLDVYSINIVLFVFVKRFLLKVENNIFYEYNYGYIEGNLIGLLYF